MTNRIARMFTIALLLFLLSPTFSLAEEDEADIEQALETTNELIAYTRVLLDCEMLIDKIEPAPFQPSDADAYFVTLEAEGVECEQAFWTLNQRGRNRGLFFSPPRDDDEPEDPRRMNFDFTHEIGPEVDPEVEQ